MELGISIHAPRAGSDHNVIRNAAFAFISIHAPRAGSDDALAAYLQEISFISIHAPRAGSDLDADSAIIRRWISIHAPRAGSDGKWLGGHIIFARFQSTLPVRGATVHRGKLGADPRISIHAPRAGSDHPQPMLPRWCMHFNPRSPCGERRAVRFAARLTDSFQSTLPVRGATRRPKRTYQRDETISIHAPRAGSDGLRDGADDQRRKFQSTLPVRGATSRRQARRSTSRFQSTLPVRGATTSLFDCRTPIHISIHAPRAGSDSIALLRSVLLQTISIHAPRAGSDCMVKMTTSGFDISIHAPRAGSDAYCRKALRLVGGFQSTLPVRGATIRSRHITPRSRFQSTLPVRGATVHPPDRTGHH